MHIMKWLGMAVVAVSVLAMTSTSRAETIIFQDFNDGVGTWGFVPGFSGTSTADDPAQPTTATRIDSNGADMLGTGFMDLDWTRSTTAGGTRIRWVTGGPPFNSSTGGNPANNTSFTTTAGGTDGFIGFYARTSDTGLTGSTLSINLDLPGNTGADMMGGVPKPLVVDGEWHLYEWDLDSAADWGAVGGIGGGNQNLNGTHTIDSLYIQNITGTAGNVQTIDFDFIAKSSSGSIAALVPEPGTAGLIGLAGLGLLARRRRA